MECVRACTVKLLVGGAIPRLWDSVCLEEGLSRQCSRVSNKHVERI